MRPIAQSTGHSGSQIYPPNPTLIAPIPQIVQPGNPPGMASQNLTSPSQPTLQFGQHPAAISGTMSPSTADGLSDPFPQFRPCRIFLPENSDWRNRRPCGISGLWSKIRSLWRTCIASMKNMMPNGMTVSRVCTAAVRRKANKSSTKPVLL